MPKIIVEGPIQVRFENAVKPVEVATPDGRVTLAGDSFESHSRRSWLREAKIAHMKAGLQHDR